MPMPSALSAGSSHFGRFVSGMSIFYLNKNEKIGYDMLKKLLPSSPYSLPPYSLPPYSLPRPFWILGPPGLGQYNEALDSISLSEIIVAIGDPGEGLGGRGVLTALVYAASVFGD